MRLCKHGKSALLHCFYKIILKNKCKCETSHNGVYILSSKHTYRPMRAHVVAQLFYNLKSALMWWTKAKRNVRVVAHNSPRVVTPISPCSISVINKKAHGRTCWLFLMIGLLFPTRDTVKILLWSSIGQRVTLRLKCIHLRASLKLPSSTHVKC